ncbi:MAG: diguanylate cyclase [Geobacter sp.]|nr:diguanylate cyclase [Geobacter sp.]
MSAVAVALVCVTAAVFIVLFHDHAKNERDAEHMMTQLHQNAHELNALEWQTIASRRVEAGTHEKVRSIIADSRHVMARLHQLDPRSEILEEVVAGFNRYVASMDEEFRLLLAGDVEGALRQDEKSVDPAFEVVGTAVEKGVAVYAEKADRSLMIAEIGATATIILAFAVIYYLFMRARRLETLRLQAEHEALRRATEFSRTVMEGMGDAVSIVDAADYRLLECNEAFLNLFGLNKGELLGKPCYELTHNLVEPCCGSDYKCPLRETVATGRHARAEHLHLGGNGEKRHVELSTSPVFDDGGSVVKVVYVVRDITDRKQAEAALLESEDKFRVMAEKAMVGVYLIKDGIFQYLNPKFEEVFGYPLEEMIGKMGPKDLTLPEDWPTVLENLRKRESGEIDSIHYEFRGLTKEEKVIELEVYGSRTVFHGEPAVIGTLLDITDRKRAERGLVEQARKLEQLALLDELTGLYNRRGFLLFAGQQLKAAERMNKVALLIFADLDGLKVLNDRLGHHEGDAALKECAAILRESSRGSDIIGRLGGDEFGVLALCADLEGEEVIVSRIEQNIVRTNAGAHRQYPLSVSFGVAQYDVSSPCSLDELIERADALMYARKVAKKGEAAVS